MTIFERKAATDRREFRTLLVEKREEKKEMQKS
jgi:hypothetical protein